MRKVIFNSSEAMLEAKRCLSCKNPSCEKGCPIGNHIRDFIKALKDDNLALAEKIVFDNSNLAFICSLVCPHEKNCIGNCILNHKKMPINVGALEAYITSNTKLKAPEIIENGKRVAIVGAGPAGINAAIELRKSGYSVTIYDAFKHIGGVMSYGIPEYRIDRKALLRLEALVNDYKIHLKLNTFLKEEDILKLKEGYDKVVIAVGLTKSRDLGIGESKRIIKASTLLREYNNISKLTPSDLRYILAYISFPQKFWKLSRDYYKNITKCNKKAFLNLLQKSNDKTYFQVKFVQEILPRIESEYGVKL